jgi:hypothetical protein
MANVRKATNAILELMDEGVLDPGFSPRHASPTCRRPTWRTWLESTNCSRKKIQVVVKIAAEPPASVKLGSAKSLQERVY